MGEARRAVAAGVQHTVALRNDGTVVAWGSDVLNGVIAIAAGGDTNLVVTASHRTIALVRPASRGQNSGNRLVTIRGTGFEPGAVVMFSGSGITATEASVVSSTSLTAKVAVSTAATIGAHNVTVTNPDGSTAVCGNCFTVNPAPAIEPVAGGDVAPGSTVVVTVTGSNFKLGVGIKTWLAGVSVRSVTRTDQQHLTVTLAVSTDAVDRSSALWVYNPDGGSASKGAAIVIS